MLWDSIDQFVYISMIVCSIYIWLYERNRIFSAIILIGLFSFTNYFFLSLIFNIPFYVVTTLTIILIIIDLIKDFKSGDPCTYKFYFEILLSICGLVLCFLIINHLLHFNLRKFFYILNIYKYFSLILAIYLIVDTLDKLHITRNQAITDKYLIQTNSLVHQNELTSNNLNQQPSNLQVHKNKNFNFFLIILICFLVLGFFRINFLSFTTLNMEQIIKLKYDTNQYSTNVDYYAPWNYYDNNYFYTDLKNEAQKLHYDLNNIDDIYPNYSKNIQKRIINSDINVKLSTTKNLKYNDEVEINVTYNEKKAKENKVKIKNTHFTKKVTLLKHNITKEQFDDGEFNINDYQAEIAELIKSEGITYDDLQLTKTDIEQVEKDNYNLSYLVLTYNLEGSKSKLLKNQKINNLTLKIEIYEQNDQIKINLDNHKFIY